jgi:hypothetical protein
MNRPNIGKRNLLKEAAFLSTHVSSRLTIEKDTKGNSN